MRCMARSREIVGTREKEVSMDKDRVEGLGKKVTGSIKEAIGKITGDTRTQAEGTADKTAGTEQNTAGGAKDTVRDAVKN